MEMVFKEIRKWNKKAIIRRLLLFLLNILQRKNYINTRIFYTIEILLSICSIVYLNK